MNKLASSHRISRRFRFLKRRQGLTLIELLIAVGLTMIIITAMIRAFKTTGDSISLGRSKMDMHNKIRVVVEQVRRDLQNATHVPVPRKTNDGYFEILEGPEFDKDHATTVNSFIGDHDDILALTVRSNGEPFRGRFNGGFVESYLAEVVWWIQHTGTDDYGGQFRLYRRVLLIRPDLTTAATNIATYYTSNDVSVRPDGAALTMNSLEDLANRRNRFAHNANAAAFPHEFITSGAASIYDRALTGNDEGFDLMLDNCVAFDIKVFDPTAEVFRPSAGLVGTNPGTNIGQVIDYDDPGFNDPANPDIYDTFPPTANANNANSYPQAGAYVNLGYDPNFDDADAAITPLFANSRWFAKRSWPMNLALASRGYTFENPRTYCTWWDGYERDGLDQDGDTLFDEGTDGVDNDGANGIDDDAEIEARPPYSFPLRSIEVKIRMIEKKSNQILQKSVRESFVPN